MTYRKNRGINMQNLPNIILRNAELMMKLIRKKISLIQNEIF